MQKLGFSVAVLTLASLFSAGCSSEDKKEDKPGGTGGTSVTKSEGGADGGKKPRKNALPCGLKTGDVALKITSEVADEHNHIIDIPLVNLKGAKGGAFTLQEHPGVEHTHQIHLSDNDMKSLIEKEKFKVTSTKADGHTHEVNIPCPAD